MTSYKRGDVILVQFPFTDGSGSKKRTALVVSSDLYNSTTPDVLIASLTSNLTAVSHPGDHVLVDWKAANLLFPSLAQTKIATVEASSIERKLGELSPSDFAAFAAGLRQAFDL